MSYDKDYYDAYAGNIPDNPLSQGSLAGAQARVDAGLPANVFVPTVVSVVDTPTTKSSPHNSTSSYSPTSSPSGEYSLGPVAAAATMIIAATATILAINTFTNGSPFIFDDSIKYRIYKPVISKVTDDRTASQMRNLLKPFEERVTEIKNEMVTQPLLRYGFKCTNTECTGTVNGIRLNSVDCRSRPGIRGVLIFDDDFILSHTCSYSFAAISGPPRSYTYELGIHFLSTRNIWKLGFDTYEAIRADYRELPMDTYASPEQATVSLFDRTGRATQVPLQQGFATLFRNLSVTPPQSDGCKSPFLLNPWMSYMRVYFDKLITSPEYTKSNCWNLTAMTNNQLRQYRASGDRRTIYHKEPQLPSFAAGEASGISIRPAQLNGKPLGSRAWVYPLSLVF